MAAYSSRSDIETWSFCRVFFESSRVSSFRVGSFAIVSRARRCNVCNKAEKNKRWGDRRELVCSTPRARQPIISNNKNIGIELAQGGLRLSYVPWVNSKLSARFADDQRERPQGPKVEISLRVFQTVGK
jgi:hypothetical protein